MTSKSCTSIESINSSAVGRAIHAYNRSSENELGPGKRQLERIQGQGQGTMGRAYQRRRRRHRRSPRQAVGHVAKSLRCVQGRSGAANQRIRAAPLTTKKNNNTRKARPATAGPCFK